MESILQGELMMISIFNGGRVTTFLEGYSVCILRKHTQRNTSNVHQHMHTRVRILLVYIILRMFIGLIWNLFDIDIEFYYGSLRIIVGNFSCLVVVSVFFWVLLKDKQGLNVGEFDEYLNGLYFIFNPLCNLGFFIHNSSIFQANFDVL